MIYGTRRLNAELTIQNPIKLLPRIDIYFFNIHSNTALHLYLGLPKGLIRVGVTNCMVIKPGGLMQHSQGLSNNLYPEPNQPNSSY